MALIIKDFVRQAALSVNEVAHLVNGLPKPHLAGLRCIWYKPAHELAALGIEIDPGCKGAFYPEHRAIIIHSFPSPSLGRHILLHEIGHYVYHTFLSPKFKKSWLDIRNQTRSPTKYSQVNAIEEFSECYALYVLQDRRLSALHAKHAFMKAYVFS